MFHNTMHVYTPACTSHHRVFQSPGPFPLVHCATPLAATFHCTRHRDSYRPACNCPRHGFRSCCTCAPCVWPCKPYAGKACEGRPATEAGSATQHGDDTGVLGAATTRVHAAVPPNCSRAPHHSSCNLRGAPQQCCLPAASTHGWGSQLAGTGTVPPCGWGGCLGRVVPSAGAGDNHPLWRPFQVL